MLCSQNYSVLGWNRKHAKEMVAAWERLLGRGKPLQCEAGTDVFKQGQMAEQVFLLREGIVLLYCDDPNGGEGVLGVRFPGQIIEHCAHALNLPYPVSARTVTPSVIYKIAANELRAREQQNPDICCFLKHHLRVDLYSAAVFIMELKAASRADRLERFLNLMAEVLGCKPERGALHIPMPLRDEHLADMLGCSARHFNRIKRQLHEAGRLEIDAGRRFIIPPRICETY